jgi:hypothetical protein
VVDFGGEWAAGILLSRWTMKFGNALIEKKYQREHLDKGLFYSKLWMGGQFILLAISFVYINETRHLQFDLGFYIVTALVLTVLLFLNFKRQIHRSFDKFLILVRSSSPFSITPLGNNHWLDPGPGAILGVTRTHHILILFPNSLGLRRQWRSIHALDPHHRNLPSEHHRQVQNSLSVIATIRIITDVKTKTYVSKVEELFEVYLASAQCVDLVIMSISLTAKKYHVISMQRRLSFH